MKKGFTLVELLAVIIIIALTSTIIFPAIGSVILQSKQDLYNSQILDIKAASEKWATENSELLDKYHVNDVYITLELLRFTGYLEVDAIKNPLTREDMLGCIQIKYDKNDKKYKYAYEEKTCDSFAESSSTNNGYIIYSYNKNKKEMAKDDTNKTESIGQYIVDFYTKNNLLKVPGETSQNLYLYESGDEYIFKGNNDLDVAIDEKNYKLGNYVNFSYKTLDGDTKSIKCRILSISKKDYSLKIIETSSIGGVLANNKNFKDSTINEKLFTYADTKKILDSNKINNYDFQIGQIDDTNLSILALKSILNNKLETKVETKEDEKNELTITNSNTVSQKIGTISVLDYVNASATEKCQTNFKDDSCKENNYLTNIFGDSNTIWTLNNNGTDIWYVSKNGLGLEEINNSKQVYPVYKLTSDVYITNNNQTLEIGTNAKPYEIK